LHAVRRQEGRGQGLVQRLGEESGLALHPVKKWTFRDRLRAGPARPALPVTPECGRPRRRRRPTRHSCRCEPALRRHLRGVDADGAGRNAALLKTYRDASRAAAGTCARWSCSGPAAPASSSSSPPGRTRAHGMPHAAAADEGIPRQAQRAAQRAGRRPVPQLARSSGRWTFRRRPARCLPYPMSMSSARARMTRWLR
jgi:hypothetical protein